MTCYSDHNEDVRTKGSCDYCGGNEIESTRSAYLSVCRHCAATIYWTGDHWCHNDTNDNECVTTAAPIEDDGA